MRMHPGRGRISARTLLHIAVLITLALAAWRYIDFRVLFATLRSTAPVTLVLLTGICFIDRGLMAIKWWQLLRAGGANPSLAHVWSVYLQASFVAPLLPTSLGGDVLRGVKVAADAESKNAVVASMAVEKVIGVLGAVTFATVASVLLRGHVGRPGVGLLLLAPPAAGLLTLALFWGSLSQKIGARLSGWMPGEKLKHLVARLHGAYATYRGVPGALALNLLLTCIEQAVQIAVVYGCARAVGVDAPALELFAVAALSDFVRKVAIVVGGWGLAEFARVMVFSLACVEPSRALALSVLVHSVAIVASLPGAALLLRHRTHREK